MINLKSRKRSSAGPNDILMAKIGMNAGACAIIPSDHSIGILAGNSLKITVDENIVLNHFVLSLLHFMQDTGIFVDYLQKQHSQQLALLH